MYDDIATYFHINVLVPYGEFIKSINKDGSGLSKDLRAAINTATALYHLREHLPQGHEKSRQEVANVCPDYNLLADIVNASKHKELTRGNPQVTRAENIEELTTLTKYDDEDGEYFGSELTVEVKLEGGSTRNIAEILTNVINYWGAEFHAMGIINSPISYSYNPTTHPLSRKEVEKQNRNIVAMQGVRFKQTMILQEYNYETGEVTPMDLTGKEVKFSMYKPKHILRISLKPDETGKVMSKEIELSDDEFTEIESLETEEEKQEYIEKIAKRNGIINKLVPEKTVE